MAGPVRLVTTDDVGAISRSLARAFEDDPVWEFLVPDPATRLRRCEVIFSTMLRVQHVPHASCYTEPDLVAAAIWDPPRQWRMTPSQLLRGTVGFARGFRSGMPNALRTLSAVERQHPKTPHYYLAILGTDPEHQGKGIGSALLRPVLDRCDDSGLGAYLESSKESNIPFYRRHGFEVTGEITLPKGPKIWPMWRDPVPPDHH
ncbi:MAG TPA: GNAT family N-acetyltransferase [Acidimicrobiales bacterium]|nr:GNAT family N-acetyltransferase [Acidimicrobiales bacterium]